MEDLTDAEMVVLLALLESADARIFEHVAPVLQLAKGGAR